MRKWSLRILVSSWIEVLSIVMILYCAVSYVDVLIRHGDCASWNLIRLMVEVGEKYE